jgi:hypothetical protein
MMNKHVQAIFEKPMNRKEFLGYIGAAILAVVGVSGVIKSLLNHSNSSSSGHSVSGGYGSTAYGGAKKTSLL